MWKPNLAKTTSNMLLNSHSFEVMPYERPTLLKTYNTLLNVTFLENLTTLLEVGLVRGLQNIHLDCHPLKGFTNGY